jgi:23S rRNA (cytidine1920-2'-O)/16S rRNA (cytidine1409-2'-O)-methyltransferase
MPPQPAARKPRRVRADLLLVERGLAASRSQAQLLLRAGQVFSGDARDARVETPGQMVAADTPLRLVERRRYVGRGGEKLAGALAAFDFDVTGKTALDIGASTGGFTDCLLQAGAIRAYAIDVGRAQLAERLRSDPRVVSMEQTNARQPFELPEAVDILVADVSFISLRLVLPPAFAHLRDGGHALVLVKPQFEAGRGAVGRGGVVKDPKTHADVVGAFCLWAIESGRRLRLLGVRRSVLAGDNGNREYFVLLHQDT